MPQYVKNELDPRLLGVLALGSFVRCDSASRLAMYCSHIGQSLVVEGATIKRQFTGVEREYGKNVHDIRMPCDAIIIKVVRKYPKNLDENQVGENPLTAIVYENAETREIGVLYLPRHHCIHQYFGFNYVYNPEVIRELVPGRAIAKDTVIATSPSITPSGDYKFGLEAQVALMSLPAVIEDGVIVSESFCKRMTTKGYGIRTVSLGKAGIPVNVHGDKKRYKIFPDIGERVDASGLLFATRSHDSETALCLMSRKALNRVDFFDKTVYAVPHAKIIDIIVYKGNRDRSILPNGVDEQCRHYYRRSLAFHKAIVEEYNRLKADGGVAITPEFDQLVVNSLAIIANSTGNNSVTPTYGRAPIDEWMVQIVFEYDVVPTIGFKITGMHGDKGVIVKIMKDEDMPIDAAGNRAEVIMDADSTIKRMNIGRLYEIYINASGREVSRAIRKMIETRSEEGYARAWDYLLDFYGTVSPPMLEATLQSGINRKMHVDNVARNGVYLYVPTDNPVDYDDVIQELEQKYPAIYGPVTYRGDSGRLVTTKSPFVIGGLYILLLEKIGNTWAGVASAKLQHFGIPAKLTNADKYSGPGRQQPVRFIGESEGRLISAMCEGDTTAEILDQTNNPLAHRYIVNNILRAKKPTDIEEVIDRNLIPRGNGRILTLIRHVMECGGIRFVKERDEENATI